MVEVIAGFECGRLGWNGHDLLATTRHLPDDHMERHYGIAQAHGLVRARDGLPWRHEPGPRLRAAQRAGMTVIWDLNHFDPPEDAVAHARRAVAAADPSAPLWICPVNEPALYPALCGMPHHEAVALAVTMARVARDHHSDVRILSTDPITGIGERQFAATDALVGAGLVDVVGVNYYPHTARTALRKVLNKTARRYGLPIMVSETSWHDGHPGHHGRHPGWTKGDWLRHILAEVAAAEARGATMAGVCWYPIVDCPPWQRPRARQRWSHGLIRQDLDIDPHLAAALHERAPSAPVQLGFDYRMAG
ncbi:glycosyl hydrolase 53 family protein [Lichenihabitans sp. Uapishka_5]|uniref:hypothetical protein n=1 Tax=Lichenihabitans sp. Uapishka_5 TaxID=3037302 RepID=UPI0029E7D494|nr:hypothetical protein [Lichenihabitans sp. Uapishka_5]MDX7951564.1 glycosyl hydrolase 53 family protein [Lichenihabitans sp. Uapishka_5]